MKVRYLTTVLLAGLLLSVLSACFHNESQHSGELVLQQHPLVGKIWDVQRSRFISEQQLWPLLASDYLLLGETHDNIAHHRLQARVIEQRARADSEAGERLAVYFEMIDQRQGDMLQQHKPATVEQLIQLLEQQQAGWDYRNMYRPVFQQVMGAGLPLLAANISRDQVLEVMQQGDSAMPDELRQLIAQTPLDKSQYQAMQREVVEAHCGSLPEQMVEPMIQAQRLRDAAMAMSLRQGAGAMKILITGNGHARRDRGVPLYLGNGGEPPSSLVSLAFVEVQQDAMQAGQYMERWDDTLPFDYLWFTPQFDRDDPCEGLKIHMQKKFASETE